MATLALSAGPGRAADFEVSVPMVDKGVSTYYVEAEVADLGAMEFMVDTGSGYLTINQETLATLEAKRGARYVKELTGILADGARLVVPVYAISELRIGKGCTIRDVEAAVFPGQTRQILGLSALRRAAPFIFSTDPPRLVLSNCAGPGT